ncbi:mandelate racemase/muconate lactonizing enzyme family protein [Sesbania bispinosa]|nr:mandelate racemase/muconate lactonizing enzyme family protein [Sesbania bispinosa]
MTLARPILLASIVSTRSSSSGWSSSSPGVSPVESGVKLEDCLTGFTMQRHRKDNSGDFRDSNDVFRQAVAPRIIGKILCRLNLYKRALGG